MLERVRTCDRPRFAWAVNNPATFLAPIEVPFFLQNVQHPAYRHHCRWLVQQVLNLPDCRFATGKKNIHDLSLTSRQGTGIDHVYAFG